MNYLDEIIGWSGALFLLVAFSLVSFKLISSVGFLFPLLNFCGAVGIAYISWKKKAYPPAVLNLIWAMVALITVGLKTI